MQVFTDKKGRNWTVVINVAAVRRVKAMLDIDLMEAIGGQLIKKLSSDPGLIFNILYVLCENEAVERGVSDRKFGAAVKGGCAVAAYSALLSELVEFFPEGEKKKETENRRDGEPEKKQTCTAEDCWGLVWKHAGVLGVNPGTFTLRELSIMAKAKKKEDWSRTAAILAQNHNMNRAKDEPARDPDSYNPYADKHEEKRVVDTKLAFQLMKQAWCK